MIHGVMAFSSDLVVRIRVAQVRAVTRRAVGHLAPMGCRCRHGQNSVGRPEWPWDRLGGRLGTAAGGGGPGIGPGGGMGGATGPAARGERRGGGRVAGGGAPTPGPTGF